MKILTLSIICLAAMGASSANAASRTPGAALDKADPLMRRPAKVVFLDRDQGQLLARAGRRCRPPDRQRWVGNGNKRPSRSRTLRPPTRHRSLTLPRSGCRRGVNFGSRPLADLSGVCSGRPGPGGFQVRVRRSGGLWPPPGRRFAVGGHAASIRAVRARRWVG